MAVASILVGILAGVMSFVLALVTGQGVIAAAGYYVMGGFLAASSLVVLALLRSHTATTMAARPSPVALR